MIIADTLIILLNVLLDNFKEYVTNPKTKNKHIARATKWEVVNKPHGSYYPLGANILSPHFIYLYFTTFNSFFQDAAN